MLTSTDLQECQRVLEILTKAEIDQPMIDFKKIQRLMRIIKDVDEQRRILWNEEKFGYAEQIVDETLSTITDDDIPF
jgi:hypothetical protein